MGAPLISICLPNLNTRPFLVPRIESILAQSVTDWELIVCDSHSTDGAWEYFQTLAGDPRAHLHQVPREGLYAGWNECLRRARGRYVYIATSDDTLLPGGLETLVNLAEAHPDCLAAFAEYQKIDEHGDPLDETDLPLRKFPGDLGAAPWRVPGEFALLYHLLRIPIWVTVTAALFRREAFGKLGEFRRDYGAHADQEFAMRLSLASDLAYTPGAVATWRVHGAQASSADHLAHIFRLHWRMAGDFLRAHADSGVFRRWDQFDPAWRGVVGGYNADYYRHRDLLYRWKIRENPREFLRAFSRAWREDRPWALEQLRRGFAWPRRLDNLPRLEETVLELAKRLRALE
jgi:glycosyltransferase involved in cell wall biosynthesis